MNRKILKSAWRNLSYLTLILFIMTWTLWEYLTTGYVSIYQHRFSGDEAKIIVWLPFLLSLGFLIWYSLDLLMRARTKEDRERYAEEIPDKQLSLICLHCDEPFFVDPTVGSVPCPKCGSTETEELSGFFERHPEKKADCPSATV